MFSERDIEKVLTNISAGICFGVVQPPENQLCYWPASRGCIFTGAKRAAFGVIAGQLTGWLFDVV